MSAVLMLYTSVMRVEGRRDDKRRKICFAWSWILRYPVRLWRLWGSVGIWVGMVNSGRCGGTTNRHSIGCSICSYAYARKRRGVYCYTPINLVLPLTEPFKNPRHPLFLPLTGNLPQFNNRPTNRPKWNKSMAVLRHTN